jgi:hypothetical protein
MLARSLAHAVVLALFAGCSSAPPPPAAEPEAAAATSKPEAAPPADKAAADDAPATDKAPPPPRKADTVPDDYELTPRDCQELARQLGSLIHSDEAAKLSPKLSDKQREAGLASIDKAADVRRAQWDAMCEKSLVGKVQERKALKCAMDAKSVAAFDVCLNGESTAAPADEPAPKGKPAGKKKR